MKQTGTMLWVGQFGEETVVAAPCTGQGHELAVPVDESLLCFAFAEQLFGSLRVPEQFDRLSRCGTRRVRHHIYLAELDAVWDQIRLLEPLSFGAEVVHGANPQVSKEHYIVAGQRVECCRAKHLAPTDRAAVCRRPTAQFPKVGQRCDRDARSGLP
jgi:hypothetical protein